MNILLINPNTSSHVTDRMVEQARKTAGVRANIDGVTADFGPAFISSRAGNAIASYAALDLAARHYAGHDAIVLGVSMDTGLLPIRELFDMPVLGMAESGVLLASTLAQKIGCLTLGGHLLPLYQEVTDGYGFSKGVTWQAIELPAAYTAGFSDDVAEVIEQTCRQMARTSGVEAVVLCGAVLTGYAEYIQANVPVPVIDCIEAAVEMALQLVVSNAIQGKPVGPRKLPAATTSIGLSRELGDLLRR